MTLTKQALFQARDTIAHQRRTINHLNDELDQAQDDIYMYVDQLRLAMESNARKRRELRRYAEKYNKPAEHSTWIGRIRELFWRF